MSVTSARYLPSALSSNPAACSPVEDMTILKPPSLSASSTTDGRLQRPE
jgi:hypothetical protein